MKDKITVKSFIKNGNWLEIEKCKNRFLRKIIYEALNEYAKIRLEENKIEHEKQLKEVAKNVRHKACDITLSYAYEAGNKNERIINDVSGLNQKIMTIQFEDVKPS